MLKNLFISGDLARLITSYLHKFDLASPGQRSRLMTYDTNRRMTYEQWWHELAVLRDYTQKPHIGLEVGACIQPEHCGVLGYLCLSSSSMLEAASNLARYQPLLYGGPPAEFEIHQDILSCKWRGNQTAPNRESDETLISALMHLMRTFSGNNDVTYTRIGFRHDEPKNKNLYEQFFNCEVLFNASELFYEAPEQILHLPIQHADPSLQRVLSKQAEDLMADAQQDNGFLDEFRKVLVKSMRVGKANQKYIAAELNISTRTLHRRLQEIGLLFKSMLEHTRTQLAKDYLDKKQLNMAEIALLLGYSEQSAFCRAFTSWVGMSPLAYQKLKEK